MRVQSHSSSACQHEKLHKETVDFEELKNDLRIGANRCGDVDEEGEEVHRSREPRHRVFMHPRNSPCCPRIDLAVKGCQMLLLSVCFEGAGLRVSRDERQSQPRGRTTRE